MNGIKSKRERKREREREGIQETRDDDRCLPPHLGANERLSRLRERESAHERAVAQAVSEQSK